MRLARVYLKYFGLAVGWAAFSRVIATLTWGVLDPRPFDALMLGWDSYTWFWLTTVALVGLSLAVLGLILFRWRGIAAAAVTVALLIAGPLIADRLGSSGWAEHVLPIFVMAWLPFALIGMPTAAIVGIVWCRECGGGSEYRPHPVLKYVALTGVVLVLALPLFLPSTDLFDSPLAMLSAYWFFQGPVAGLAWSAMIWREARRSEALALPPKGRQDNPRGSDTVSGDAIP